MTVMKGWFLFVILIVSGEIEISGQAESDALQLEISSEQMVFDFRGDVSLIGHLRCKCKSPLRVNRRFSFPDTDITFSIRDASGALLTLLPGKPPRDLLRNDFIWMREGSFLEIPLRHIQTLPTYGLPPGDYRITVTFRNMPAPQLGISTGDQKAVSNELRIRIQ